MVQTTTLLLLVVAGLTAVLTLVLLEVYREKQRARQQVAVLEEYRLDLTNLVRAMQKITGNDWQRSIQVLISEAVAQGYGEGIVLLALSEQGNLESRAAAFSPHLSEWDALNEPNVQAAHANNQVIVDRPARRVYLPVQDGGEVVGVMAATGVRLDERSQGTDLPFLEAATHLAGFALSAQRALQKQVALSTTDGLTGLLNHRHFQQTLGVNLAQAYLQGQPLSLVMFDIDNFKSINDTYGHLFGDLVLRELAHISRRVMPSGATVARYGGEEFAMLLPETSLTDAERIAERLRAAVEANEILDFATGHRVRVTVSIGVASYTLGMGKPRLIQRADDALYASKKGGKNRVTVMPVEEDQVAASQEESDTNQGGEA